MNKKYIVAVVLVVLVFACFAVIMQRSTEHEYTIRIVDVGTFPWRAYEEEGKQSNHFFECNVIPLTFGMNDSDAYGAKVTFTYKKTIRYGETIGSPYVTKYTIYFDEKWRKMQAELNETRYTFNSLVMENKSMIFDFSDALYGGVSKYKDVIETINITNPTGHNMTLIVGWKLPKELNNRFFDLYVGNIVDGKEVWQPLKKYKTESYGNSVILHGNSTMPLSIRMVMHGSTNVFIDGCKYNVEIKLYNHVLSGGEFNRINREKIINCEVLT